MVSTICDNKNENIGHSSCRKINYKEQNEVKDVKI